MDLSYLNLSEHYFNKALLVLVLFFILVFIRIVAGKILTNAKRMPVEQKRRFFVNLNFFLTLFFLLSMAVIWTDEIKSLALSVAAIMVALVIATKEFTINLLGGFFKIAQNAFHVGDRIEIDGIRGDVIDRSLLTTTLVEVGPGKETHQLTGRSVVIPNSMFLEKSVINESYLKNYVLHIFKVPLAINSDWEEAQQILLERSQFYCSEFFETAQDYLNRLHQKSHLEVPVLKPRVHINIVDHEKIDLIVRITAPAPIKGRIEQKIIKDFLKTFYKK